MNIFSNPNFWIGVGVGYAAFRQMRKDLNGVGRKSRILTAETIILSKNSPDFEDIVRRLVIGG